MDIVIIIALIVAGLLLFMAEVFLIPGLSLAGIASAGCLIYVNYYAFAQLGATGGLVTLIISLCSYIIMLIWFLRSKAIDKLALKKNIDSTVGTPAEQEVKIGDTGVAITRLALIGNAEINGKIIEVKSADGFLNEHTPIVVERIMEGIIMVRKM
jgi:membrane-bound ClpP family serine protease